MTQEIWEITLEYSPGPFGDNLEDNLVNSFMASRIYFDDHTWLLFPHWRVA